MADDRTRDAGAPVRALAWDEMFAGARERWSPEARVLSDALRDAYRFRARIRMARVEPGLARTAAARLTGEGQGDIGRVESGKVDPSADRARRHLDALRGAAAIDDASGAGPVDPETGR